MDRAYCSVIGSLRLGGDTLEENSPGRIFVMEVWISAMTVFILVRSAGSRRGRTGPAEGGLDLELVLLLSLYSEVSEDCDSVGV